MNIMMLGMCNDSIDNSMFFDFVFNACYILCTFFFFFNQILVTSLWKKRKSVQVFAISEHRHEKLYGWKPERNGADKRLGCDSVCEKMDQSDVMLLELQRHKKDMAGQRNRTTWECMIHLSNLEKLSTGTVVSSHP